MEQENPPQIFSQMNSEHLVVLIHGLNGYASDFDLLASQFLKGGFMVYAPVCNQGKTSDGIQKGAQRIFEALKVRLEEVKPKSISIVGHVLGGLYARYLVCLLFKHTFVPEKIKPEFFITVGTPHTGTQDRAPFGVRLASLFLDETGRDLMVMNRNDKDPVLIEMVNDLFLGALKEFQARIAYVSTSKDDSVQSGKPKAAIKDIDGVEDSAESLMSDSERSLPSPGPSQNPNLILSNEDTSDEEQAVPIASPPTADNLISTRLKSMNWKTIKFTKRTISERMTNTFWVSKQGVLVANDILERMNPSHVKDSPRRKSIYIDFESNASPIHLVVLIHGLDGFGSDMEFIAEKLSDRYQKPLITLLPECNHGKTHDGIQQGAERIVQVIKNEIASKNVRYISLIGHSLGGLYARCAAGKLWKEEIIPKRLIPLNFITFASPHLGSREHEKVVGGSFAQLVGNIIGQTGNELMLNDGTEEEEPLLIRLTKGHYRDCLASFQRLSTYSNTKYDVPVHYSTAAIRKRGFITTTDTSSLTLPAVINDDHPDDIGSINEDEDFELRMIENLNKLPWNRYAVIPTRPLLAHVDIIIKSEFWNRRHGFPVISHMLDRFRHPDQRRSIDIVPEDLKADDLQDYRHLIVIVPGLEAVAHDLLHLAEVLRDQFPRPIYKIVIPNCNDYKTKDGIFNGSKRLLTFIHNEIENTRIKKISFIGESIGGLYARCVVGLLYETKFLPDILEPVNFITVSSPHLGIRNTLSVKKADNAATAFTKSLMSITGLELNYFDAENHILSLLTEKEFLEPLKLFKNLITYANIKSDLYCPFWTCAISLKESPEMDILPDVETRIVSWLDNRQSNTSSQIETKAILLEYERLSLLNWKSFVIIPEKTLVSPVKFYYWEASDNHPLSIHIAEQILE